MSNRRVRIYAAESFTGEPMDVIGAGRSATGMFGHPAFDEFMQEHHKEVGRLPKGLAPVGGVSAEYRTVQPPLDDEQLAQFGQLCVAHIIDGGHNDVLVIDQRQPEPIPTLAGGTIVAVG